MITDARTGAPLESVEVALLGEKALTLESDETGYFAFKELLAAHHALVRFSREGYETTTLRVELDDVFLTPPQADPQGDANGGGSSSSQQEQLGPVLVDASVAMNPIGRQGAPSRDLEVAGWVYGGGLPAVGARVLLFDVDEDEYVHEQLTDESGRFRFESVSAGHWILRVWPHDRDGNGIADFMLHSLDLGELEEGGHNLTNLAVHLEDVAPVLRGAAFQDVSTRDAGRPAGFPIEVGELHSGVDARLPAGRRIYLHWGSEVDTASAVFTLRERGPGGTHGAVLPLTASWQTNHVMVELIPSAPLVGDSAGTGYLLSIDFLRLKDGTVLFSAANPGRIRFEVWERPSRLFNPRPVLFFAHLGMPGRPVEQVAFDAAGAWLLDEAGDPVYGYDPDDHWTNDTGFQLAWKHVPGAASYRIYARNTLPFDTVGSSHRPWREVSAVLTSAVDIRVPGLPTDDSANGNGEGKDSGEGKAEGDEGSGAEEGDEEGENGEEEEAEEEKEKPEPEPEPESETVILASAVMKEEFDQFGPQGTGFPWLFGNGLEIAVVSVGPDGFEAPLDPTRTLTLVDTKSPFIVAVNGDFDGDGRLARTEESGARFHRVFHIEFSEPMNTASIPVLTARSGNVSIDALLPVSWSTKNPDTPVELSDAVAIPVLLRARGSCTEITVDRVGHPEGGPVAGDRVLVVTDASTLPAGGGRVLFASPSGEFLGDSQSIVSSDPVTGQVVLGSGLVFDVPAGTLACLAAQKDGNVTTLTAFENVFDPVEEPTEPGDPGDPGDPGGPGDPGEEGDDDEEEPEPTGIALLTVSDATIFHRGQKIVLYRQAVDAEPAVFELRTVTHVDTVQRHVRVDDLVSESHSANVSLAMPFDFVPEYRLREGQELLLLGDVAGNANVQVPLVNHGPLELMKGDRVLFDVDGDLLSTTDRVETTVKEVRFIAGTDDSPESFRIVVDLPEGTNFVRGVSKVLALGDAFELAGVQDTSQQDPADGLDLRRDAFSFEAADASSALIY